MKKISIVVLVCMFSFSCETDKTTTSQGDSRQQLKNLSAAYLKEHADEALSSKWPPNWWKVLCSDVVGALAGGAIGSGAGPAGAAVGALVGGAVASTATAAGLGNPGPIPPDPYTPGTTIGIASVDNDFDYLGHWHYYTLNKSMLDPTTYEDSKGDFDKGLFVEYAKSVLIDNQVFKSDEIDGYDTNITDYVLTLVADVHTKEAGELITLLYDDGKISLDVKTTIEDYFDCMEASADLLDFADYSKTAEEIVEASNFSASDKQIILSTMATARYGAEYWSLN